MTAPNLFGEAARAQGARRKAGGPATSGYARLEKDAYNTPPWCVDACVAALARFGAGGAICGPVWEPACGRGLIVQALRGHGLAVIGSDVADYGFAEHGFTDWVQVDFLTHPMLRAPGTRARPGGVPPATILTNPPFGLAEAFVERALMHMILDQDSATAGRVVMLLPHEWDTASTRADLFDDPAMGFAVKIALRSRITWIGPDGVPLGTDQKKGPMKNHAWFVWDRRLRDGIAAGRGPAGVAGVLLHAPRAHGGAA
jgi:hypothetical protein